MVRWRSGDQLPHTSRDFSDPTFMVNPGDWRDKLIGSVESIENDEDADEFRLALMTQLSYDLVHSHDVPSEMAVDGAGEFADWLIATYRKSP